MKCPSPSSASRSANPLNWNTDTKLDTVPLSDPYVAKGGHIDAEECLAVTESKKLRVAVAGTSFAGAVQIPVFQSHARTQVVALSSGRAERAAAVAAEHGVGAAYTDFEEMLDSERPDLVSITTPPHLHHPMVLSAARRGIHILCEKPFALNSTEAEAMLKAADEAGVIAMVDFEFRYLPARTFLMDLLRQNYVGKIRMVEFSAHFGWRSDAQDVEWNWWSDERRGGGLLGAVGSHAVDSLQVWMGKPRRVMCDLSTFVKEREGQAVTSDDAAALIIEFSSGAQAVLHMSAVAGVEMSQVGIYGSKGQLVIPDYRGHSILGGKRSARAVQALEVPSRYQLPKEAGHFLRPPFRALVDSLVDAIAGGRPSPNPNFKDGLISQQVLDAARASSKKGCWVEL